MRFNWSANPDPQRQAAASPQVLPSGYQKALSEREKQRKIDETRAKFSVF